MNRNNLQLIIVAAVCLVFILGVKFYLGNRHQPMDKEIENLDVESGCNLVRGCKMNAGGSQFELGFESEAVTMKPFQVYINLSEQDQIIRASLDFSMQGMDMGVNRFEFHSKSKNRMAAEVLLPICVRKRTDWNMKISVETDNKVYEQNLPVNISPR